MEDKPENNIALSGNEARALMVALATATGSLPSQVAINLWTRLNEISQVQPPATRE
jgi:hypothetical protein